MIQELVLSDESNYITSMRNRTTGQFSGTLFMLIQYLIVTYGKIPTSQLFDLEQEKKEMRYNPQIPSDTIFNQVGYLLEYGEMSISLYTQIKTMNIVYTVINKTRKFQDAIKTWNRMNPIQKRNNFKTYL